MENFDAHEQIIHAVCQYTEGVDELGFEQLEVVRVEPTHELYVLFGEFEWYCFHPPR